VGTVGLDQAVEAVALEELDRSLDADRVLLAACRPGWPGRRKDRGDDRRAVVRGRMVPDVLQHCQDFQILEQPFGDLPAFRIKIEVVEAENLTFAWQSELAVEGRPVDFITELDSANTTPLVCHGDPIGGTGPCGIRYVHPRQQGFGACG
jgi:hypothetical protein